MKRFLLTALAVLIVHEALGFIIHQVLLTPYYQETYSLWRMPEEINMPLIVLVAVIWSLLFTYIFTKGYEGKGPMEGIRYGLLVGLLISVPGGVRHLRRAAHHALAGHRLVRLLDGPGRRLRTRCRAGLRAGVTRRLQLRGAERSKPNSRTALPSTINAFSAADRKSQCTRMKSSDCR